MTVSFRLLVLVACCTSIPNLAEAWPHYFGYFGSHYIGTAVTNCGPPEFSNHTNVLWANATSAAEAKQHAEKAAECGKKVVIAVFGMFFQKDMPSGAIVEKSPGAGATAGALATELSGLSQHVAAIFTIDEPFQLSDATSGARSGTTSAITSVHNALHSALPTIPLAINFSTHELQSGNARVAPDDVLNATDWLGFDCFLDQGSFDNCGGLSYPAYVNYLKSKLRRASQRIFLAPPAFVARQPEESEYTGTECQTHAFPEGQADSLEDFLTKTRLLVQRETVITGVFPYTWSSYCDTSRWYESAAVSTSPALSEAKQMLVDLGTLITQRTIVVAWPLNNMTSSFTLSGWAIDKRGTGTGVEAIHVWARNGSGAGTYLGAATLGITISEAAILHGPAYGNAGFELQTSMPLDTVQLEVYAYNNFNLQFETPAAVHRVSLVTNSSHTIWIDQPTQNQTVGTSFPVTGWVFGRSNLPDAVVSHNGIDAVHVWAYNHGTGQSTFLGPATVYGWRPDVMTAFSLSSPYNGYGLTVTNLPSGTHTITVYAHSTLTGQFSIAQQRTVVRP